MVDRSRSDMYSSMCAHELHGNLLADPFDCAQFIQCDYGQAKVKKCSRGLRYDSRLQVCNWDHLVQCDSSNNNGGNNNNNNNGNDNGNGSNTGGNGGGVRILSIYSH